MDEVGGVQSRAAGLTLVTIGSLVLTAWAGAGDVAVSEELLRFGVVVLFTLFFDEAPLVVDGAEDRGCQLSVRGAGRTAVDVEGDTEVGERLADDAVVAVYDILWRDALLLSLDGDGHTVLVTTADEEHLLSTEAQVAGIDI